MSSTSKFKFIPLKIQGAYIVECDRYHDNRGFFQELYRDTRYENVVHGARQISFSASKKNVVRGIHCSQYGKLGTNKFFRFYVFW
jgi:dTDP-4-dehydrorhamnose 3,5-epimerase-like enzyme